MNPLPVMFFSQLQTKSSAFVILLGLFFIWARSIYGKKRNKYLPPGPKGIPILGNFLQLSKAKPWKVFEQWGKEYGEFPFIPRFDLST